MANSAQDVAATVRHVPFCAENGGEDLARLADFHEDWKGLLKPDRHIADVAENESEARQHKKAAHDLLHRAEMAAKAGKKAHESAREASSDPKGNGEPERIDGEQAGACADRFARGGNAENGAEHRTYAGRPAEGEGKAHDIGAGQRRRLAAALEACLARENADAENAEEIQAHDDDDEAADLGENIEVLAQQQAYGGSAGTQRDEHRGEPQGEEQRRQQHVAANARLRYSHCAAAAKLLH